MARRNYYNKGDFYSEWSRNVENKRINWIDIDKCGLCDKCWEPLYLAETCYDKGQEYKTTHTTERLATLAGLPSFLVFYKVEKNVVKDTERVQEAATQALVTKGGAWRVALLDITTPTQKPFYVFC